MSTRPLVERFLDQAEHCLPGSPLYHLLLTRAAEDLAAGGVVARVLAGHEVDPDGSVPALRLMGAVHRLVLDGRAAELSEYYPSAGGTRPPAQAWPAFRRLLEDRTATVRELLERPVQTNEVGRSAALYGALMVLTARAGRPIRLLEVGASGGLNLRVDHFGYQVGADVLGDPASEVRLARPWEGRPPAPAGARPRIVQRRGCDPAPLDPLTAEGRLTLTSYVWADWRERLDRLRAAIEVAGRVPARVDRAHADRWLSAALRVPTPGLATVVWHSLVWQYVEPAERARARAVVLAAARRATEDAPLAHIALEPRRQPGPSWRFEVWLTMWPALPHGVLLGVAPGHGVPTTWL
ncbi:MAG: DUF2332 domain-containing protein [Actinomycetota bacterium]|nr:DUF2332 domain-containing protein [Actinomycetota bacterium]